jgi:radical SAM superfamily enzyme YgiQ (UPF0313 family)
MGAVDLVLVKPGSREELYGELGSTLSGVTPPLDIGLIAGFIRERGYSVRVIDAEAQNWGPQTTAERIAQIDPLLVGIFSHTVRMTAAGEILRVLKRIAPGIKRLLGGRHPSALPERTIMEEEVDFVCQGEAFYPLMQLIDLLRSGGSRAYKIDGIWYKQDGRVISNPRAGLIKDLDELPLIAWDLMPMDRYRAHNWHCFDNLGARQPYGIIYTSLGCPFNCSYCCVNAVYGRPGIRYRSPEKVVQEIDLLVNRYNVRNIRVLDDTFTLRQDRVERLCDLIVQRGYDLNMWCYARVDTVSEGLLKRMKRAGVNWVAYGIESGNERVREGVQKRTDKELIERAVQMAHSCGIHVIGNFIFGLPEDNLETMQETLKMAKALNLEYVNFYVTMAWPGSRLYEDALRRGIRLPQKWHGYAQLSEEALPLPTKYLTPSEVLRFRDWAFEEYFSNPTYLESIERKFGPGVVEHIKGMLRHKIIRRFS